MTASTKRIPWRNEPVTLSPVAVVLRPVRWTKRPLVGAADDLDAINSRLNADQAEFLRLAELNTLRITGKPRL